MTTALAPIAAIDRVPLLLMLFPFLLYLNISHTEWKVIRLCTNDFQAILTRAIANPLTAHCHSRTGSLARCGACPRWGAPHRCWGREPPACGILPGPCGGSPLVHSVNGFRLDKAAVYF